MKYLISLLSLFIASPVLATDRLYPDDLTYSGAFKIPSDVISNTTLDLDGGRFQQMGFDSEVGGLVVFGKDFTSSVTRPKGMATVIVPATPVISATRTAAELNTATFATGKNYFVDLTGGLQGTAASGGNETAWLSTMLNDAEVVNGKYQYVLRMDYTVAETYNYRLGWADTDFANLNSAGLWGLSGIIDRWYDGYMFTVDSTWADSNTSTSGKYLGIGRGRTNGSNGPSFFALAPWTDGNPLPAQANVTTFKELISYTGGRYVESFSWATYYNDAIMVTDGTRGALIVYADGSFRHDASLATVGTTGTTKWWTTSGTGRSLGYKDQEADSMYTSAAVDATQTTIPLVDASMLAPSGLAKFGSEYIKYTGITNNTLTGCTRGFYGAAASHAISTRLQQVMPDIFYYGNHVDGYDTLFRIPMLLFYDLDEISEVANGTRDSWDIQPYAYKQIANRHWRSPQARAENYTAVVHPGITTDGSGNIFVGEFDGIRDGFTRKTLIHTFSLISVGQDSVAPSDPTDISVTPGGTLSWTHSKGNDDFYIVYKYFTNAYKTTSEYRPVMSTTANTWTDPYYINGDNYEVQVVDGSMNLSARVAVGGSSPITPKYKFGTNLINSVTNE